MKQRNADTWSVFDILGPVMVGPSSSHTGGACKLGYLARCIFGPEPEHITLRLHGSFGEVYEGHCTDVALLGGLLGMLPSNGDIIASKEICAERGIEVVLEPCNLGAGRHPNTVEFVLTAGNKTMRISGSSIGGGKVLIESIDKVPVHLTNSYSSLLLCFNNQTFSFNDFLKFIIQEGVETQQTKTFEYKDITILDIETKGYFVGDICKKAEEIFDLHWIRYVNHISHYTY